MWLTGAAATTYRAVTGFPQTVGIGRQVNWAGDVPEQAIFWANFPLVFFISTGIAATYFILKKLFNTKVAILGAVLLTLEPFYIAQSQVLHLDAVTATLMLLSSLLIILYLEKKNKWHFILSAVLGGLAIVNRSSAIFLILFSGLTHLVYFFQKEKLLKSFFKIAEFSLLWTGIAVFIFVAVYPALWVNPLETLREFWGGGFERPITTVHPIQNFFLGETGKENFGPLFYVMAALLLTGPASLIGTLVAVGKIKDKRIFLLFCYLFFFFVEVSLVAKQGYRYFAPFFPVLAVLGAFGLANFLNSKNKFKLTLFFITMLITWQAVLLVNKYPYIGTFFNPLFGGHKTASKVFPLQDQGEGYDLAAEYVNSRGKKEAKVYCSTPMNCQQLINGKLVEANEADYIILDRNKIARGLAGPLWEKYKNKKPLKIISFDNIPYVWIFER